MKPRKVLTLNDTTFKYFTRNRAICVPLPLAFLNCLLLPFARTRRSFMKRQQWAYFFVLQHKSPLNIEIHGNEPEQPEAGDIRSFKYWSFGRSRRGRAGRTSLMIMGVALVYGKINANQKIIFLICLDRQGNI